MTQTRIPFKTIVKNQLPDYVRDEFPLLGEFLSQYYLAQEFQGAPLDLLQNIDRYIKLNNNANVIKSTSLRSDITSTDTTILVSNTNGYPDEYGLIKIDNEIITYTEKNDFSFIGCIRGFQAHAKDPKNETFVFSDSDSASHKAEATVENLSVDFLSRFFKKVKHQFLPGLEDKTLSDKINKNLFVKQAKDFYTSKGTDQSFKILFKALYGEDVEVLKPAENLFTPSQSLYKITKDMIVEPISGNVMDIVGYTMYQNEFNDLINKSYAPVTNVERIIVGGASTDYYQVSFDANYSRDLQYDGAEYGEFVAHPKTKLIGDYTTSSKTFDVDSTVGFPKSGELLVTYDDRSTGIVSYTSKSLTQFYGITDISNTISDNSTVGINTFATVLLQDETVVSMRIVNVLTDYHVGELVGWVKGRPYYGPYHIHKGRKMVGAKHVSTPHDYIYDTKEASLLDYGIDTAAVATSDYSTSSSISAATNVVSSTSSSASSGGSSGGSSGSSGGSSGGGGGGYGY
jgi:hypothetical protein